MTPESRCALSSFYSETHSHCQIFHNPQIQLRSLTWGDDPVYEAVASQPPVPTTKQCSPHPVGVRIPQESRLQAAWLTRSLQDRVYCWKRRPRNTMQTSVSPTFVHWGPPPRCTWRWGYSVPKDGTLIPGSSGLLFLPLLVCTSRK